MRHVTHIGWVSELDVSESKSRVRGSTGIQVETRKKLWGPNFHKYLRDREAKEDIKFLSTQIEETDKSRSFKNLHLYRSL